jgi:hypothetical protein
MGYTLTLEVPEDVYEPLAKAAEQSGQKLEALAVEWLVLGMHTVIHDPLEEFIGSFTSDLPDWTEKHDEYLGQILMHSDEASTVRA